MTVFVVQEDHSQGTAWWACSILRLPPVLVWPMVRMRVGCFGFPTGKCQNSLLE
jgi:hypothetical protein